MYVLWRNQRVGWRKQRGLWGLPFVAQTARRVAFGGPSRKKTAGPLGGPCRALEQAVPAASARPLVRGGVGGA